MANSIFKSLHDALKTSKGESPLVLPCANDFEANSYMAIFVSAFFNHLQWTDPSFKANPVMDSTRKAPGEYAEKIGSHHFGLKFDRSAQTFTISSEGPYPKQAVRIIIEDMNRRFFHRALKTKDNYFIPVRNEMDATLMPRIFGRLGETHQISGKLTLSTKPIGYVMSAKNFEKLCKQEKLPDIGMGPPGN